ncbi:glycosyltransferase [Calothrix sp. PCC 6303]|uniref:glycosyltransferase n=1 Tax=Calothrix sp. PCC 6303 TaxID=1170562 RepID=UPI0002A00D4F|nr:glycosyltransferase [Calothrix sp. PCC 6303]AFZ03543.1 glycosyl transferase family 2 [Calothrix sp. PCC 6303]
MKIAAYITAYNDLASVEKCLQAIHNQSHPVEKIYILDNSAIRLITDNYYQDINIEHHPENQGIGYGISWAISEAIKLNYDFLWVFDQDSIPAENCLQKLLEIYLDFPLNQHSLGIIAPTSIDIETDNIVQGANFNGSYFTACPHKIDAKYYECDAPITSGSLINLAAAKTIDLPCVDFFIDGIDIDYGWRFRKQGYHNLIVTDAIMQHQFGQPLKVNFLSRKLIIQEYSSLRHYYICRNHTYIETRNTTVSHRLNCVRYRFKYMLFSMIKILLYDSDQKGSKLFACFLGTYHGFIGKLGKIWELPINRN